MIPVRPCASVSWISPARRWRSSTTPASLAWARSWSCRLAFSAIEASSLRFASASSLIICPRSRFCSSARLVMLAELITSVSMTPATRR
jgi:hypothetical protein